MIQAIKDKYKTIKRRRLYNKLTKTYMDFYEMDPSYLEAALGLWASDNGPQVTKRIYAFMKVGSNQNEISNIFKEASNYIILKHDLDKLKFDNEETQ